MSTFFHTRVTGQEYPKLQVNKRGEIILAFYQDLLLTRGMLVGYTKEAKDKVVPIGKIFSDWEASGELEDYDEEVTVQLTMQNNRP